MFDVWRTMFVNSYKHEWMAMGEIHGIFQMTIGRNNIESFLILTTTSKSFVQNHNKNKIVKYFPSKGFSIICGGCRCDSNNEKNSFYNWIVQNFYMKYKRLYLTILRNCIFKSIKINSFRMIFCFLCLLMPMATI